MNYQTGELAADRVLHLTGTLAGAVGSAILVSIAAAIGILPIFSASLVYSICLLAMLGCSAAFWLQPLLQKRLLEVGWDVPVLEGARAAIEVAKMLVYLGVDASGLAFPGERPAKWRRRKIF